jgi:hypothetical protein
MPAVRRRAESHRASEQGCPSKGLAAGLGAAGRASRRSPQHEPEVCWCVGYGGMTLQTPLAVMQHHASMRHAMRGMPQPLCQHGGRAQCRGGALVKICTRHFTRLPSCGQRETERVACEPSEGAENSAGTPKGEVVGSAPGPRPPTPAPSCGTALTITKYSPTLRSCVTAHWGVVAQPLSCALHWCLRLPHAPLCAASASSHLASSTSASLALNCAQRRAAAVPVKNTVLLLPSQPPCQSSPLQRGTAGASHLRQTLAP